jgi:hypothetical protein
MKAIHLTFALAAVSMFAADKKPGAPAEASSEELSFTGTMLMEKSEIDQALGAELPEGILLVRLKATPKGSKPLRVSPDDFTLLSRKDGERSPALAPGQIAGRASITVKAADKQMNSWGMPVANGPIWAGIGKSQPGKAPEPKKTDADTPAANPESSADHPNSDSALLAILKAKSLPDGETTKPVEGLLYFRMDGKNKLKDLTILYKGDAGRMVADFK